MEHVSTALSRTITTLAPVNGAGGASAPRTERRRPAAPVTLHDLIPRFEAEEALENPDVIVPLASLRATGDGVIDVPRMGVFGFTDWSRRQVATLLGVRWDRWFENASPAERADELNRRFARATGTVRLRTTRERGEATADGTLRAFVSPGYSPVPDSRLARMLAAALSPVDPELRLVRSDVTDRSVTYVVRVGKAFRPGGDGAVGDVWGGILVRNSGVGFASLLVMLHLTRLLCTNGLTAPLPDALLVRRRHRGFGEDSLRTLLAEQLSELPEKLAKGADILRLARERAVVDVDVALAGFLGDAGLPRRLIPALRAAYDSEPSPTAFGIAQAATLAAQGLSPEERLDLEAAAGAFLAGA